MLRIFHNTHYDFIKWWRVALIATAAFIVVGFASMLITGGVKYSIDFTGGTLMQVQFNQRVDAGQIRSAVDQVTREAEIAQFGSDREYTIRAQRDPGEAAGRQGAETIARRIEAALTQRFGASAFHIGRTEAVGARVGGELQRGALYAILVSFLLTLAYLAIRFEWRFGLAAVIATAHDILTTLALLLFAGEVIRPFAWVMLFGVVTGTFSSIYIASSVLIWIENKYPRKDVGAITKSTSAASRPPAPRPNNQAVGAR